LAQAKTPLATDLGLQSPCSDMPVDGLLRRSLPT
jgi:hypothetical protein